MKQLAVIILNWNGIKLLQQLIPDAIRYTVSAEVDLIVADNGSSDGSVEWLRNNAPEVKIIEFKENHGFAKGYNLAVKQCSDYPFCCLLNSDVLVTEGWWQPILKFIKNDEKVGAVQPKIKDFYNRESFEYAGAAGGMLDQYGYPYCRGRLFDIIEKDKGQYDSGPCDIAWASGACLTVRTDLYLKLGGLDPDFFAHQEEIDLCIRIQGAGYRVCFLPDSEVYHMGGASLQHGNPRKTYLNFRNNLLLIHKNSPSRIAGRRTFLRRLIDTAALLGFVVKADFKNAAAVWNAHRDFRKMARNYTSHPADDILRSVPGSERKILLDRYLPFRKIALK